MLDVGRLSLLSRLSCIILFLSTNDLSSFNLAQQDYILTESIWQHMVKNYLSRKSRSRARVNMRKSNKLHSKKNKHQTSNQKPQLKYSSSTEDASDPSNFFPPQPPQPPRSPHSPSPHQPPSFPEHKDSQDTPPSCKIVPATYTSPRPSPDSATSISSSQPQRLPSSSELEDELLFAVVCLVLGDWLLLACPKAAPLTRGRLVGPRCRPSVR